MAIFTFAVQASDFDFQLLPASIVIAPGTTITPNEFGAGGVFANITSYNGFNSSVSLSKIGGDALPGLSVGGSGTPPADGTVTVPLTISLDKSTPFSTSNTPYTVNVQGKAIVGNVTLIHNHPLAVTVNFVYITGPYDGSKSKAGPNTRNADGSITTDSVLNYDANQLGNDPWRATSALTANNTAGLANLMYDWSADYGVLSSSFSSSNQASYQVNRGDSAASSNSAFPATTATAKGTYGSNTYTIRWHHNSENWAVDASKPTQLGYKFRSPDSASGFPSNMDFAPNARWNRTDFDFDGLIAAGEIASVAGAVSAKNPVKEGLYQYIGLQFGKLGDDIKDITTFGGSIPLDPVFEGGATNPLYLDIFTPDPVAKFGYNDSLSPSAKIAIESHYQATEPQYCIPYDLTPFIGDSYDTNGYAGTITDNLYIYNPGKHTPDSHVVCKFILKVNP